MCRTRVLALLILANGLLFTLATAKAWGQRPPQQDLLFTISKCEWRECGTLYTATDWHECTSGDDRKCYTSGEQLVRTCVMPVVGHECWVAGPPPDSGQGGWWYPLVHIATRGHRGPNTMLVIDTALPYYPFDSQCAPTYRVTGPGRTANPCDRFHFWSLHGGGANFLFVDGAVRFLSYSADPIMPALISINGGEAAPLPD